MKKLLLLLMFVTPVFAQERKIFELTRTMKCGDAEELTNDLAEKYGEKMVWSGKDENNSSYVALYKNKDTGTWTLIQYGSKVACVLSSGSQGTPV
jgi:hypothetical protein